MNEEYANTMHLREDSSLMYGLQQFCPILYDLINTLQLGGVPPYISVLLKEVVTIAELPFSRCQLQLLPVQRDEDLAFYLNFPKLFERGNYKMDKMKSQVNCKKRGSTHPSLLPAIFTVFCEHGMMIRSLRFISPDKTANLQCSV